MPTVFLISRIDRTRSKTCATGESDAGLDSHELALVGKQAVKVLVKGHKPSSSPGTASRTDIGLFESSGRGFNFIKPIFLSKTSTVNLPSPHWLRRSSGQTADERKIRVRPWRTPWRSALPLFAFLAMNQPDDDVSVFHKDRGRRR